MTAERTAAIPLLAGLAALGTAFAAQRIVHTQWESTTGWGMFAGAAVVFALVARRWMQPPSEAPASPPTADRSLLAHVWAAGSVAGCVGATVLAQLDVAPVAALLLWLVGLACGLVWTRHWSLTTPRRAPIPWSTGEVAAFGAILLLGATLRLVWLDDVPPYYFGDEPRVGLYLMFKYREMIPNFFSLGWNTWPVIGLSLQGFLGPVIGLDLHALRLAAAIFGTLAVAATYGLARQMFAPRMAILAALLFAFGRTSVDFSRMGICHVQVILFQTAAFFFWWRAVNSGRAFNYLASGIALGLCYYTYNAGQLALPLWLVWLAICALTGPRRIGTYWRGVVLTLFGFAITVLPLATHVTDRFTFGQTWYEWTYMSRNRQIIGQALDAAQSGGWSAGLGVLQHQAWLTWLGFNAIPTDAYKIGYRGGGMLDDVGAALFVLGLAVSVVRFYRAPYTFILLWWVATAVAGGVLTIAPPSFVRMVGLLPCLAMLTALPLDGVLAAARSGVFRLIAIGLVSIALLYSAWENFDTYFRQFPSQEFDFMSELGYAVKRFPADSDVVVLGPEHYFHFTREELFQFEYDGRNLMDAAEASRVFPVHAPMLRPLGIILGPTQRTLQASLSALYPQLVFQDVKRGRNNELVCTTAVLTPEIAAARAGLEIQPAGAPPIAVADPFAATEVARGGPAIWSGALYWPAIPNSRLEVESSNTLTVTVGGTTLQVPAGGSASTAADLPLGWLPVRIEEQPGSAPRRLSMRIVNGGTHELSRWAFRPDHVGLGLTAEYATESPVVRRSVEPQLNLYALEGFYAPGERAPHAPFRFSARGGLRVEQPGNYSFEIRSSGPYRLAIDGNTISEQASVNPDEPLVATAQLDLGAGVHSIEVSYAADKLPNTTRRIFQVYWTPPGGEKTLIPLGSLEPAA